MTSDAFVLDTFSKRTFLMTGADVSLQLTTAATGLKATNGALIIKASFLFIINTLKCSFAVFRRPIKQSIKSYQASWFEILKYFQQNFVSYFLQIS